MSPLNSRHLYPFPVTKCQPQLLVLRVDCPHPYSNPVLCLLAQLHGDQSGWAAVAVLDSGETLLCSLVGAPPSGNQATESSTRWSCRDRKPVSEEVTGRTAEGTSPPSDLVPVAGLRVLCLPVVQSLGRLRTERGHAVVEAAHELSGCPRVPWRTVGPGDPVVVRCYWTSFALESSTWFCVDHRQAVPTEPSPNCRLKSKIGVLFF